MYNNNVAEEFVIWRHCLYTWPAVQCHSGPR